MKRPVRAKGAGKVFRQPARVAIRTAKGDDAKALGGFFLHAWREAGPGSLGFTGATEDEIKEISSEEFLAQRLLDPKRRFVVAERGGEVLGFASVRCMGRGKGELSGVVVLESETGRGLGTKLVERACEEGTKLGIRRMVVKTEVFNERALEFYKKNGFIEVEKTTEKVGKTPVPTQVLERNL